MTTVAQRTSALGLAQRAAAVPWVRSLSYVQLQHVPVSWFGVAWTSLVILAVLLRLPFMTHTLYAFDSANYALAVRDFYNVAFHQPHPPGYPVYVGLARAINLLTQDANRALIVEGLAWSALAVAATIGLSRALFGKAAAILSGILLTTTVGFWGYGEVAYPYVALAGETATLAWLTQRVLSGHRRSLIALAAAWAIAAGVRWDAAVFCLPLLLWAWLGVPAWRIRLLSIGLATGLVTAWAVPMVLLSGGWSTYAQALRDYLQVWSPQSAYVPGELSSGGDTQATYNLNFLVNYLRQMLGVGLLLVPFLIGRRFGPAHLGTDHRSRLLLVWTLPPLLVYVFAHLGEPGYVLSLAPQAAILAAIATVDLRDEVADLGRTLCARGWRWLPSPALLGRACAALLGLAVVGWNVQAFARGVGPGRLPDLRAHDATTQAQVEFVRRQPPATTLVLAHDILRQLQFYLPGYQVGLLYSEYVPDWQTARSLTPLPPGTTQVVILDAPVQVPPQDAGRLQRITLQDQPPVSVWVLDTSGVAAVRHGYQFVATVP